MDILAMDDLIKLVNINKELFITIYMPTIKKDVEIKQNPIRLKSLLRDAESKLYEMDMRKTEVEKFLAPASDLIDQTKFWQNQSDGLVIFLYPEGINYFRLPIDFKESLTISNKLYVKPLLPLFSGNGQFHILAISKNQARLFKGTRQMVKEIELENAPEGVSDVQVDEDPGNVPLTTSHVQSGSGLSYNKSGQGQANQDDYEDNQLSKYLKQVDDVICQIEGKEKIPLVLAGVEYLIPIYKGISKYPNIVDEFIKGNPEILSGEELRSMAWNIVEPIFTEDQKVAEAKFEQFSGQNNKLFSTKLNTIIPAAFNGQIESLFIADGMEEWGVFDHDNNKIKIYEDEDMGNEDLLEYASILTLSRGGKVFAVEQESVPEGGMVAAVLRY